MSRALAEEVYEQLYSRDQPAKDARKRELERLIANYRGNTEVLKRAVAKITVDGYYFRDSLTPEEMQAFKQLSEQDQQLIITIGRDNSHRAKRIAMLTVFIRYMKLYLQTYKGGPPQPLTTRQLQAKEIERQEKIRARFSANDQRLLDNSLLPSYSAWQVLRVKPEFLRFLAADNRISDLYSHLSAKEIVHEADSAAADIAHTAGTSGLMLFAPSGWGKSRLLGRSICYQHAVQRIGCVVLDVVGATIDNALDRIARHESVSERQEIGSRIRYCNMGGEHINGETFVTGWPMLVKRYPDENLHTTTQRIVDLIRTTDGNLATASIQGFNRLAPLLTSVATVLSALGLPLALAYQVLSDPATWKKRILWVGRHVPEAAEAVAEMLEFYELPDRKQEERAEVLRNKLRFLRFDPVSRGMFSAAKPLIDWAEVAAQGLQVYIDLRNEPSPEALEMKLFWVWNSLMEYIRSRGSSGRHQPPLAVVIDELSYFVRGQQLNTEAIIEEFREFVQVRRRNANILLTAATQERSELPPTMQSACLQLPSHLYGATSNPQTALENANRWYAKNPKRTKSSGMLYFLQYRGKKGDGRHGSEPIELLLPLEDEVEQTPLAYMSLDEQEYENSRNFLDLKKGEWLFAKSPAEGVPPAGLEHITTAQLDAGKWVREDVVSEFRRLLMQEHGIPVSPVLSELTTLSQKQQRKQSVGETVQPTNYVLQHPQKPHEQEPAHPPPPQAAPQEEGTPPPPPEESSIGRRREM